MEFYCFATHFTSISCSSETSKGKGVKVYIFWKLSSRPIQKLMFQDYIFGTTYNIWHQRPLFHDICDKRSTHLKWIFCFTLKQRKLWIYLNSFQTCGIKSCGHIFYICHASQVAVRWTWHMDLLGLKRITLQLLKIQKLMVRTGLITPQTKFLPAHWKMKESVHI